MLAALKRLMASLAEGSLNFLLFEVVFNTKIDSKKFKAYLDTKDLAISDGQLGEGSLMKSAVWDEDDESIWCAADASACVLVTSFRQAWAVSDLCAGVRQGGSAAAPRGIVRCGQRLPAEGGVHHRS